MGKAHDLEILTLSIYLMVLHRYTHTILCTRRLNAVLFIVVKYWKQPKSLSPVEWANKLWCTHTMKYYTAMTVNIPATCNDISIPHKHNVEQKKQDTKQYSLYNSSYIVQLQRKFINRIKPGSWLSLGQRYIMSRSGHEGDAEM